MSHVQFQAIDADHNVHGDPSAIDVHVSTGALIMLALGLGKPTAPCDVAGTADPDDVIGRCMIFGLAVDAGMVPDRPGIDVAKLRIRVDQVHDLAVAAKANGHRITWA